VYIPWEEDTGDETQTARSEINHIYINPTLIVADALGKAERFHMMRGDAEATGHGDLKPN
jgi:hypothetical protein